MRTRQGFVLFMAVAVVAAACTGDDAEPAALTTVIAPPATTESPPPSTTAAPPPTTQPPTTGDLSATLQLDGRPLAGVDVFLGVNVPSSNADFEARFACTDSDGVVVFAEVPFDVPLLAVTGPGINGDCSNSLFLDTSSTPALPLAQREVLPFGEFITGHRDLGVLSIRRLPGSLAVAREAIAVIVSCFGEGDVDGARRHLADYERLIAAQRLEGTLSSQDEVVLDGHTGGLRFAVEGGDACSTTGRLGPVPVLFDWTFTPEEDRPIVTLVDAGSEPLRTRTYSLAPGMVHEASVRIGFEQTQEIDGDLANSLSTTVDVAFTTEVAAVGEERFVLVTTTEDSRVRSSDGLTRRTLESAYANLVGTSTAQLVAPTGEVLAVESSPDPMLVDDPSAVLASATPPLPAEPIGVGAVWTVRATVELFGVVTTSTSTYTLTEIDGPLLTVEIESVHDVDLKALVNNPALSDAEFTVTQTGSGQAVWDLTAAVQPSGSSLVSQLLVATATFGGVESTLEQVTESTVEFPSPGAFSPPDGTMAFVVSDNTHVEGEVAYEQDPPAGGPHSGVWQNCGFYDSPIETGAGVHSQEHGAVWITYQPGLPQDQIAHLQNLARTPYTLVSPYPGLDTAVVASGWGVQLRLDSAFDPRLAEFVDWYAAGPQTPEPGAPCEGGIGEPLR